MNSCIGLLPSTYNHSLRVPLLLAGPGIPQGETRNQLCYLYDIHPTLCERAGLDIPATVQFQSHNPTLKNATTPHRDHLYSAFKSWQRALRDERFKLIEYRVNGQAHTQLFDLVTDSAETNNLATDPAHSPTLERLRALLIQERVRLNDGNTPHPFSNRQGVEFWSAYDTTTGHL